MTELKRGQICLTPKGTKVCILKPSSTTRNSCFVCIKMAKFPDGEWWYSPALANVSTLTPIEGETGQLMEDRQCNTKRK